MKKHKYRAVKTTLDGITFASKAEAFRYATLRQLEQAGDIRNLKLQPVFPLLSKNGTMISKYIADFCYYIGDEMVVEDVKGMGTPVFNLKKKWFEADYAPLKLNLICKMKKKK